MTRRDRMGPSRIAWMNFGRARVLLGLAVLVSGTLAVAQSIGDPPPAGRRSAYDIMARETQAIQDDDTTNPGMLWVLDGAALWGEPAGLQRKTYAGCHGGGKQSMRGVAARYPAFDDGSGKAIDLEERVNQCRTERQAATSFARESRELLALTAYVGHQSRGLPIAIPDTRMTSSIEKGRGLYEGRQGQLALSCAQCHDDNAHRKLAGVTIPEAHPTGYPLYRLEWQAMGSLQRRLRNCLIGMRAEPYAYGADEYVALEAFLKWRACGMRLETPAVRP